MRLNRLALCAQPTIEYLILHNLLETSEAESGGVYNSEILLVNQYR
jgi:hypothetical protein